MLGKFSKARHAVVGAAVGLTSLLAGLGVIGGQVPERFDARTIVVARQGDTALRITEYVDIDFGDADRRGYLRRVPNDFGVPSDVVAFSPDAEDDLAVFPYAEYTEIRVGDPDVTFTGQHRYELSYTLPDAMYERVGLDYGDDRHLAVDLVSPPGGVYPGDAETTRFEVVVTGFELDDLHCDVGALLAEGGCSLTDAGDGTYRAVLEPLEEDAGLTVGGALVGFGNPVEIAAPPLAARRDRGPNRGLVALGFVGLGAIGAVPVFRWARRRGRNEVYAGGAADAAYGTLPPPGAAVASPPVSLVTDDDLGDLATIEFVPPKGIDPWEGHVLLTERCGDDAVESWISGLVGREAVEIDEQGKNLSIGSGPRRDALEPHDAALLDRILSIDDPYVTGEYDKKFASAWSAIHKHQVKHVAGTGWWKHLPPGSGFKRSGSGSPFGIIAVVVFFFIWSGSLFTAFIGAFRSWPAAILLGLLFPTLVAYFMYRVMLPARSAHGSALALQAESFRRFLHASEGHHVEWAWSQGLLREYSAWAVALGEADAWSNALERANVPAAATAAAGPIIVHTRGSSMRDARTAPSSSGNGGGGGGGFSGGGVGGGGGGGSSGSW